MFEKLYYEALESSVSCPNTLKSVHFSVLGYRDETAPFLVFDVLLENNPYKKMIQT